MISNPLFVRFKFFTQDQNFSLCLIAEKNPKFFRNFTGARFFEFAKKNYVYVIKHQKLAFCLHFKPPTPCVGGDIDKNVRKITKVKSSPRN